MTDFGGKVALVTGAASGIGRAICGRLAAEGAEVVVVDVDEASARETARDLGATALEADVSDPADWEELASRLDRLDLACLNAGVMTGSATIADLTDEQYRRILGVNVDGIVLGVRALLPLLERDGGGDVVVTASLAGLVAMPTDPVYAGTKHFVVGFVRSVAPELADHGVTINVVCPGIVDTPLLGEMRAGLRESGFPLLRPDEVADAVVTALRDGSTGEAWACQPGREPEKFRFPGVPGPRVPGYEGVRPPI